MGSTSRDTVCRIVADVHERKGGVPAVLCELGVDLAEKPLRVGDYELPGGILVERKTVLDLHSSVVRGRLWRQMGALRGHARLPYVLVEGRDLVAGPVDPAAIRGVCLAILGQGIPIVWSRDARDSALWLRQLALRAGGASLPRDRPAYAQRLKPPAQQTREAMLAAVPGVSTAIARRLLERFETIAGVVSAGQESWATVPGVGRERAAALANALYQPLGPSP